MWKSKIKINWSTQVTQWRNWSITISIYLTPRINTYIRIYQQSVNHISMPKMKWNSTSLSFNILLFICSFTYSASHHRLIAIGYDSETVKLVETPFGELTHSISIWHMHSKQCDFIRRHTVTSNFIVWPPLLYLSLSHHLGRPHALCVSIRDCICMKRHYFDAANNGAKIQISATSLHFVPNNDAPCLSHVAA